MTRDAPDDSALDPLDETALSERVEQTAVSPRGRRRDAPIVAAADPEAEVDADAPADLDDETIAIHREERMPAPPSILDDDDTIRAVRSAPRPERVTGPEHPSSGARPDSPAEPPRTAGARIAHVPAITHPRYRPRSPEPGGVRREQAAAPVVRQNGRQPAVDARAIDRELRRTARRRAALLGAAVFAVLGVAATALVLLLTGALA